MTDLRARLAALGVGVFDAAPEGPPIPGAGYADLLVQLVRSGDARLRAAIPCLLAAHDGGAAATAARQAIAQLGPAGAMLAFLYRIARCLVASRRPDLSFRGVVASLPGIPEEPADIPGPDERLGRRGLQIASELACERSAPDLAGAAAAMFDLWVRLPVEAHEPPR